MHEILLSHLKHDFGIRCTAVNWFLSYLSNRNMSSQTTKNQQKRPWIFVCVCVPQDSVLGPVLFILYITPLTCLIEKHSIRHEMFADDIPFNHFESPENYLVCSLEDCVKDIGLWMKGKKEKSQT